MCGIAGIATSNRELLREDQIQQMEATLLHRGPDDGESWISESGVIGLAHRRLSILDLSPSGHQPMHTVDGRYTIVFNGEIYNFIKLRDELETQGTHFQSSSDTEVLLELYAAHGPAMLSKLAGMFAFAIWDRDERSLFLARDPLGIKPLYLAIRKDSIAFASEVRALIAGMLETPRLNGDALGRYFLLGSVQEPDSLIDGISVLPAGNCLLWKDGSFTVTQYWRLSYSEAVNDSLAAQKVTRDALNDSIRRHFVSDVPVGIFLSGGIDSTAILALAKANGFDDLHTFCISFDESEFNEGDIARRTADHFGATHTDWRLTSQMAKPLIESYLASVDSPSNDGFNTFCVSKLAHDHGFKVVLSGLGGDELFGGYPSFQRVPQLLKWHTYTRPYGQWLLNLAAKLLPAKFASKLERLKRYAASDGSPLNAYWTMRAFFAADEAQILVNELTGESATGSLNKWLSTWNEMDPSDENLVGYLETTRYMRNQLLRDSDVLSMAHGLELRVPFVDSVLYDRVNSIAASVRYRSGKQLLLDAVPEIPSWVANQPKKGFRFPFEKWMLEKFGDSFESTQNLTTVHLDSWYRKWIVFSLIRFSEQHGLGLKNTNHGLVH